jgi:uncharacterized membrane protein YfcA
MTEHTILFLILGGLAGGFVNGFSGTGTALFAMGFFLSVLEPRQAVAVVALISVLAGVQGAWVVRHAIVANPRRLMRFLIPGLAGVPIGISLLEYVDARSLRFLVAGLLIVYGGYFGFRRALPKFERRTPVADMGVGLASGVLGGLASLSGSLPAIWLSLRPWPKAEVRAVMQPFNLVILSTTVVLLAFGGVFTRDTWLALSVALPAGLIAAQIGITLFKRVNDDQFRRTLIILCLALGVGILIRELVLYGA